MSGAVIVTGAGQGLGAAIAAALALSGVGLMTAAAGAIETDECPPADTAEVRGGAIGAPGTPVCDEPEPTPKKAEPEKRVNTAPVKEPKRVNTARVKEPPVPGTGRLAGGTVKPA